MNKRVFASLLITVFALGFTGCTKEESSSSKAEEKETKPSASITEVTDVDDEMENIKTTPYDSNSVVEEDDGNDYSIGLLLTEWSTPIGDIPEIDPSLDRVLVVDNTTNHFNKEMNHMITTDELGKMIRKQHTISSAICVSSRENEKKETIKKIISAYELPSEYITVEGQTEINLQFGYIKKYDGDVTVRLGAGNTVIVVTMMAKSPLL